MLEEHGVDWEELVDWYAYHLWKHGRSGDDSEATDEDKMKFLEQFEKDCGENN